MEKIITITFMILSVAALAFTSQNTAPAIVEDNPGCIVMPEVIEACHQSGGRFDYGICSCVGGGGA